jgi:AcrR family transcriptional regulator
VKPKVKRPGGRSARVRKAVHDALVKLLAKRDRSSISVADIAALSGVHPTSIYRRWGTLEGLYVDVNLARIEQEDRVPDTGSLRGDLLGFAKRAAARIASPAGFALLRALLAMDEGKPRREGGADAGRARFLAPRKDELQEMLDRATARGERTLQATDVLDGLLAPLYMRFLFGVGGVDDEYLAYLVDRALSAPPSPPPPMSRHRRKKGPRRKDGGGS